MPDIARRLSAEAIGTGFLLAGVVGSGIMAERLTDDVALQLLCNAVPTGGILFVIIMMFGALSGAHFNPAVTIAMTIDGSLRDENRLLEDKCLRGSAGVHSGGIDPTKIERILIRSLRVVSVQNQERRRGILRLHQKRCDGHQRTNHDENEAN